MMSAQLQQQAAAAAAQQVQSDGSAASATTAASSQQRDSLGAGHAGADQLQQSAITPTTAPAASSMRNRAGDSSSPYILAHKDTPVNWQLLDDDAVELARRENKLIFMNIGFKACHYCRLTTQDSFSNPSVASLLNSAFVPIIVDREERPDVDSIYMNYIQAVNSAGGWPLNVFLTPQLEPVFGGTYWPGPSGGGTGGGGARGSGVRRRDSDGATTAGREQAQTQNAEHGSRGGERRHHSGGAGGHSHGHSHEDEGSGDDEDRLDFLVILRKLQKIWAEQEAKCRREAKEIVIQLREFAAEGTLGTRQPATTVAAPTPAMSASTVYDVSGVTNSVGALRVDDSTRGSSTQEQPAAGAAVEAATVPVSAPYTSATAPPPGPPESHIIAIAPGDALAAAEPAATTAATASAAAAAAAAAAADLDVDLDQLEEAYTHIAKTFDPINGGFNLAPKFPTPSKLSFLLRLAKFPAAVADVVGHDEVRHAAHMALLTLRRMRDGGLRDHVGLGGSFARYSATDDWSVPHFERMVVDNALLLGLYLDAWLTAAGSVSGSSGRPGAGSGDDAHVGAYVDASGSGPKLDVERDEFADVVLELAGYLSSAPIRTADGLFATSEASDSFYGKADSHMREGGYYLWTRREFDAVVSGGGGGGSGDEQLAHLAAAHWDVREDGNVDRDLDPHDEFINQNVLRIVKDAAELSAAFGIPAAEVQRMLATANGRLRARREKERVRPEVDDQAVASCNGMVISALARTGAALRESGSSAAAAEKGVEFVRIAGEAAKKIKEGMWEPDGKGLYRTFRRGRRGETPAFAEDYAFLIEGLLDLYEATGEDAHLRWADELQRKQIDLFYDHINPTPPETETPTSGPPLGQIHSSRSGGFYTTTATAPHAILRLKDGMDTSQPSTNSISASNLFRLGLLLPRSDSFSSLCDALARETIRAFEVEMLQYPWLFTGLLSSVVTARLGGGEVTTVELGDDDVKARAMMRRFCTAPRAALRGLVWSKGSALGGRN